MTRYRWMKGQNPKRKAHLIDMDGSAFLSRTVCQPDAESGLGVLSPAGKTPHCGLCEALEKRLRRT
jgi:hypothetical protein